MSGVLTHPEWDAYEYTSRNGIVLFDPRDELAGSRQEYLDAFEETDQAEETTLSDASVEQGDEPSAPEVAEDPDS